MGNTITQNAMSKNAIRGIVLDAVGTLTAYQHGGGTNPLPVPIPGAGNNGLPAPVILGAVQAAGAKMRVIDGTSCNKCLIEIFVAAPDATGAGQGSQFIGSANATGAGVWKSGQVAAVTGQIITATATDPSGNTSEFSANFTVK
jgi:hypothetical protein